MAGNRIYLNPSATLNYGNFYMAALVTHEVLHNLGKNDPDMMKDLNLSGSSNMISMAMLSCVPQ